jgi:uncharacterized membrane protein
MAFEDAMVVICMLDEKIKMKQTVHFIAKVIIGDVFLDIIRGIFTLRFSLKWT